MKPEEQRKPFRSVGMRMQRFSQTLMRSYSPPTNDLPTAAPMEPVWQPATQIPLSWQNESPVQPSFPAAPVTPAFEASAAEIEPQPTNSEDIQNAITAASQPTPSTPAPQVQRAVVPPAPAAPQVQRAAAPPAPTGKKMDPRLLAILSLHQDMDADRDRIREEKKAIFSANNEASNSGDNAPIRRKRSSANFDYIETSTLAKGEETHQVSRKTESDTSPAPAEPADDATDDDSAPSAQASGPPDISREVVASEVSPTGVSADIDTIIQRAEAPIEVASPEAGFTKSVALTDEPTAEDIIQRAEAPVEVARPQPPVASETVNMPDMPVTSTVQPSAEEVIQRAEAPVEAARPQSPVASQDVSVPAASVTSTVEPSVEEVIQRAEAPVEAAIVSHQ